MSRSVRSSLFLLVAPFAVTFTLVAWLVDSKIGPWLDRPLVANCAEKDYPAWFCGLQEGLLPWLAMGLGILILLSVTAWLSLGLFRAHLRDLQQDVLDFQKGHRGRLPTRVPRELAPLVQLLSRILLSGAPGPSAVPPIRSGDARTDPVGDHPIEASETSVTAARPVSRPPQPKPAPDRPAAMSPSPVRPRSPATPPTSEPRPVPRPKPEAEDLEVSLRELDADIERALQEPEPEPEPEKSVAPPSRPARQTVAADGNGRAQKRSSATSPHAPPGKNLAFPAKKCRKIIAMLGQRYPNVNFELITDVEESVTWAIREAELTEVFGELLDNAGKWAESQVNIFLAIKGNMLVFGVADDGPGVAEDLAPRLGEEDLQVNDDQSPGRGLPTVRRLIEVHGGSLAFDRSRLGGLEAIAAIPGSAAPRHTGSPGHYH